MKTRILVIALLGYSVIALSGCTGMSKKDTMLPKNSGMLEPAAMTRFMDIPVPANFKLMAQESYSFENSGVRAAVLRYQGKANPDQVISFYKEQMPMYNWNLLNIIEYGDRLMNFEKETETCIINLLPKGSYVTIAISLGPKSQSPRKLEKVEKIVR